MTTCLTRAAPGFRERPNGRQKSWLCRRCAFFFAFFFAFFSPAASMQPDHLCMSSFHGDACQGSRAEWTE